MRFAILEKKKNQAEPKCPVCGERLGDDFRKLHKKDGFYYCEDVVVIFRECLYKKKSKEK